MATVLLAIMHERFDATLSLHLWARRYVVAVVVDALSIVLHPWVFALCSASFFEPVAAFSALLSMGGVSYLASQFIVTTKTLTAHLIVRRSMLE